MKRAQAPFLCRHPNNLIRRWPWAKTEDPTKAIHKSELERFASFQFCVALEEVFRFRVALEDVIEFYLQHDSPLLAESMHFQGRSLMAAACIPDCGNLEDLNSSVPVEGVEFVYFSSLGQLVLGTSKYFDAFSCAGAHALKLRDAL